MCKCSRDIFNMQEYFRVSVSESAGVKRLRQIAAEMVQGSKATT